MRVRLIRRWGRTRPGESVDVDPVQGRWLIDHGFGTAQHEPTPAQEVAAPGVTGSAVPEGGEDSARGEVSAQHEPVGSVRRSPPGRRRKAATPRADES